MKKKFSVVVCVVIALLVSLSLAACGGKKSSGDPAGGNPAAHTHEYAATYQRDDAEHWRECKTCGETTDRAMHEFDGGNRCTVCGYTFTAGLSFSDVGTDECHLKGIGTAINETDIIIPASYDGRKVTGIDSYAFENCDKIRSVTIPSSIKTIGTGAFNGCTALGTVYWNAKNCSQVTLPIFDGCTGLKIITVKDDAEYLPKGVFSDCSALENLTVPFVGDGSAENSYLGYLFGADDYNHNADCVPSTLSAVTVTNATAIGDGAFYGCAGLSEITLPANATSIGDGAFYNCAGLSEITIPENITEIGDNAFYNCNGLTSITLPTNVAAIGEHAFDCSSLEKIDVDPGNTAYISRDGILYNHEQTEFVHIPRAVKGAVVIPDGITSIHSSAFYGCSGITAITIPQSVTEIGYEAFGECNFLKSVHYDGNISGWCAIDFSPLSYGYGTPFPVAGGYDLYIGGNKATDLSVPQGVTKINAAAFSNCNSITSVTLSASVTEIDRGAFNYCRNLKRIDVNSGNTTYSSQDGILYNHDKTEFVCIPRAIEGAVTIPEGITAIDYYAFRNSGITEITIPESVTSIGSSAFSGCYQLQTVNWNAKNCNSYESSYYGVSGIFSNLSSITTVNIGANAEVIPAYAFANCYSLRTVTFAADSKLKTIGDSAFSGCGITEITIPTSVTSIGSGAFSGCGIAEIIIPQSVTSIGSGAFLGCENLRTVTFDSESKLESIGSGAFSDCGITEITIPQSVTSIGSSAFSGCAQLQKATFNDLQNWTVSRDGSYTYTVYSTRLQDQTQAAQYLTGTYCDYTWTKG